MGRVWEWVTTEGRFYPDAECSTRAGGRVELNKLTSQAPGFHIIDHVICHTTLDTSKLVPAEGLECATRAFLSVIDQVNKMTLAELRAPYMLQTC